MRRQDWGLRLKLSLSTWHSFVPSPIKSGNLTQRGILTQGSYTIHILQPYPACTPAPAQKQEEGFTHALLESCFGTVEWWLQGTFDSFVSAISQAKWELDTAGDRNRASLLNAAGLARSKITVETLGVDESRILRNPSEILKDYMGCTAGGTASINVKAPTLLGLQHHPPAKTPRPQLPYRMSIVCPDKTAIIPTTENPHTSAFNFQDPGIT